MELGSPKSVRQANSLETHARYSLDIEFSSGKPQSLLLKPLPDWLMPTHIIKDNLFYLKSAGGRVNHSYKIPTETSRLMYN